MASDVHTLSVGAAGADDSVTVSRSLKSVFDPNRNSLALLRLVFAGMVLIDHAFPIGGFNHNVDPMWGWTRGTESFGGLAVAGFFIISGFLVTRSFVESSNAIRYLWKRVLRIFPGFWVCLLVTVAVFAPLAYLHQYGSLHGYVHGFPDSPGRYLQSNYKLAINQYNIDGLLGSSPYAHSGFPAAFDGSLWTLIYEFKCYIAVGMLGVLGLVRHFRVGLLGLFVGLWIAQIAQSWHPGSVGRVIPFLADPQMIRLAFLFSIGCVVFLFQEYLPVSDVAAGVALGMLLASFATKLYPYVGGVLFAYLVFWAAVRIPIRKADKYGDFSYGLYIYAFPVEQLAAIHGLYRWGFVPYVLITLVVSLGLAMISWHVVEKPAMRLKRVSLPLPRVSWRRARHNVGSTSEPL
jgi:peptidoglycan/LPS O-acetylase OafA/YrhL